MTSPLLFQVILNLGWSYPADMWSVGCILGELITGKCKSSDEQSVSVIRRVAALDDFMY